MCRATLRQGLTYLRERCPGNCLKLVCFFFPAVFFLPVVSVSGGALPLHMDSSYLILSLLEFLIWNNVVKRDYIFLPYKLCLVVVNV